MSMFDAGKCAEVQETVTILKSRLRELCESESALAAERKKVAVLEWKARCFDESAAFDGTRETILRLTRENTALTDRVRGLEGALREIAKGEGRYSCYPLTHAENTIEDMKALAVTALAPPAPAKAAREGENT